MPWSKPDFVEISLNMEATAYVNTDGAVQTAVERDRPTEETPSAVERETAA